MLWTFSHLKTQFNGAKIIASPSATSGQRLMVKNGILLFWMVLAVVVFVREYDEWRNIRLARSEWLVSNYQLEKELKVLPILAGLLSLVKLSLSFYFFLNLVIIGSFHC